MKDGGGNFRARCGVEHDGVNILAEGSFSKGSEIQDGYPEFSADMLKQLGWWDELTDAEKNAPKAKLEDRYFWWHPTCCDQAWLYSLW